MISPPAAQSPFKFLDAYTAQDKDCFFGRDAEQQRLVELLFRSRLILVYGQSGTGKTSLVQCGLAKALSASDYFPVLVRRRGHILTSLQSTLTTLLGSDDIITTNVVELVNQISFYSMRPVYLIFDQLEELFVSGEPDEQHAFFSVLTDLYQASFNCKVLLVMREDYIAYLYPYEDLIPELFNFRLRVEPMSERGLQEVIIGICQQTDRIRLEEEKETVRQIIQNNQGGGYSFQLPYLQVYLDRLWRLAHREHTSGIVVFDPGLVGRVGAIGDVLEQFLTEQIQAIATSLPLVDKPTVKRVLEAFVTYEGTRREHKLPSLAADTGLESSLLQVLLPELERSRILTAEEGTYELAHDSLAKLIDKGRSAEQRQLNDILRRLKEAYAEYTEKGWAADLLLPARRLSEIQLYQEAIQAELIRSMPNSEAIWQFVADSQQELQRRQRRQISRLRTTIGVVSGLLLLAIGATVLAIQEWEKSNVKSVVFQLDKMDPLSAQVMSAWAFEKDPTPITAGALYNTFYNQRLYAATLETVSVKTAAFSPDGKVVVTATEGNQLHLWDWQAHRIADSLRLDEPAVSVSVGPDAQSLLAVTESGKILVWTPGKRQRVFIGGSLQIRGAGFSPDGQMIIGTTDEEQIHRWVRRTSEWRYQGSMVGRSAGFPPTGSTLLTLTGRGPGAIWGMTSQQPLSRFTISVPYASEHISPDGRHVLLTTKDSKVYLWDAVARTARLLPDSAPLLGSGFSPDGTIIWTASEETLHLWTLGAVEIRTIPLHKGFRSIALSPDGQTIMLVTRSNKVHLLNLDGLRLDFFSHRAPVMSAVFSPDGQHILTTTEDGKAYIWQKEGTGFDRLEPNATIRYAELSPNAGQALVVTTKNQLQLWQLDQKRGDTLPGLFPVRWATFTRDGLHVLAVSAVDGKTRQWSLREKRIVGTLPLPPAKSFELSNDGEAVLVVPAESETIWFGQRNRTRRPLLKASDAIHTARFSADGALIVAASEKTCYLLNKDGTLIDSLANLESCRSVELSPDGKAIVIATYQPKAYVWTPATKRVVTINEQDVVKTASFCADGKLILTMINGGKMTLWSTDGRVITQFDEPYSQVWVAGSGSRLLLQNGNYVLIAPAPDAILPWYRRTFSDDQIDKVRKEAAKKYAITTSLWQSISSKKLIKSKE